MSPVVPFEFDPRNDGYWGDTTSTLDWCEANYEVTTTLDTAARRLSILCLPKQ